MPADSTAPAAQPAILPLGQDGILVHWREGGPVGAFAAAVRTAGIAGVTEVAAALTSVLVRFAPDQLTRAALADDLRKLLEAPPPAATIPARRWTIPACFGADAGPQLAEAAALADLTPEAAVQEIAATDLAVLAIGFAPGQPYIGHLPQGWDMPRQRDLTARVPAGAIVVALRQIVLFANASPTGWRWIGSSAFAPFKADRADPFALRVGDRIRFAPTDAGTIARLRQGQDDGLGGATLGAMP